MIWQAKGIILPWPNPRTLPLQCVQADIQLPGTASLGLGLLPSTGRHLGLVQRQELSGNYCPQEQPSPTDRIWWINAPAPLRCWDNSEPCPTVLSRLSTRVKHHGYQVWSSAPICLPSFGRQIQDFVKCTGPLYHSIRTPMRGGTWKLKSSSASSTKCCILAPGWE